MNGIKTWTGLLVYIGQDVVALVLKVIEHGGGDTSEFARLGAGVLVVIGILHKGVKALSE